MAKNGDRYDGYDDAIDTSKLKLKLKLHFTVPPKLDQLERRKKKPAAAFFGKLAKRWNYHVNVYSSWHMH